MLRMCRLGDRQESHLPHRALRLSGEALHWVEQLENNTNKSTVTQVTLKTCCSASRMALHVTLTAAKRRADSSGR
jgi:hypothetical protein